MSTLFNEKHLQPTEEMLTGALCETKVLLDSIGKFIETEFGEFHREWKFYGSKLGWSLKLFNKKRNVLFVGPETGYFRVAFAIGEKVFQEILRSELPDSIKNQLSTTTVYAEGRPLRLEIRSKEDAEPLFQLIKIKLSVK